MGHFIRTPAFAVLLLGLSLSMLWLRAPRDGVELEKVSSETGVSLRSSKPPKAGLLGPSLSLDLRGDDRAVVSESKPINLDDHDFLVAAERFGKQRVVLSAAPTPFTLTSHERDALREDVSRPAGDRFGELSAPESSEDSLAVPLFRIPAESEPSGKWAEHQIRDGDTLPKIAELYLKDESRAMEIFASNREVLADPELLPLHATLRIYVEEPSTAN